MREILFKAKRIDNGEWVEGQYCYMLNPKSENGEPKKHFICNGTNVFNTEIDPETICQYTGLKDKNGKKIFEFDKVKVIYTEGDEEMEERVAVNWCSETCSFSPFNWEYMCDGCDCFCEIESLEVIGNIHDKEK